MIKLTRPDGEPYYIERDEIKIITPAWAGNASTAHTVINAVQAVREPVAEVLRLKNAPR